MNEDSYLLITLGATYYRAINILIILGAEFTSVIELVSEPSIV